MAQDLREQLYRNLINSGKVTEKEIGSLDDFRGAISDEASSRQFYKNLIKSGAFGERELGTEDDFYGSISNDFGKPTQQPAEPVQQTPTQKSGGGYKPTEQEMMGFNMAINSAQGAIDYSNQSLDKTIQNLQTYSKQNPLGGGINGTAKTAPKWNAETGQMEQKYISSAGTEHDYKHQAEQMSELQWKDNHPLDAAEREIGQDFSDIRSEEERLTEQRKAAEENKRPEDKTWWDYFKEGFGASAVSGMAPMGSNVDRSMVEAEMARKGAYGAERQAIAKESDVLMARRRLAEEARQLITDVRKDKQGFGILGGFARAGEKVLEKALDPHTWDFGEADLASQMAVADAVIKSDSGLGISQNEQKLLDTWAKNAAINSKFADQLSGWTKAGIVTGESLPFMLEMAMNPASGLGEAATTQLLKYSLKKYGTKWVKDHAKSMLAKKIATRLVGDVVGAGIMASTTGAARVAADYERRMTGQADIALDDKGDVIYNGIKQDTKENPGAAFFKALSSTSIENWSEMAGNYLGFMNSFFGKALGKTAIGKAGRRMLAETGSVEGVSLNKAQKFIYELASNGIGAFSPALKQFAERTQWHGVVGEYLEEVMGNIANAAVVGDKNFNITDDDGNLSLHEQDSVWNLQDNIDTFCGVALMGGFMSALNTVGYAKHRYDYDVDRVSNANAKLFGDELWEGVKTMIDNSYTDPRELNDALTYILRGESGKQYSAEEKKAVLKYTQAVLENQGAEMATYQPRMASSTREEVNTEEGKKYVVTSLDKNGDAISQQAFDSEDEAMAYEGELKMNQQQRDYKDYLSMTNKLSYPEAAQAADEFLAENGYSYLNDDDAAAMIASMNDPKTELGKQFRQYKMEKILQKAENNRAAIESFEEENGWTPGTVAWLAEQDPMQLDAEGLAMADQARTFLEGLAYPAGEVHVEHEQQVGAETAKGVVENVISTEEPIDPNNNAGKLLLDEYKSSVDAMAELFDRNEDLKEEFYRLQGMGLSPQEVISSLDSFRPEDIQTVIDYYNANARYMSFMDEAAKQIDDVAHRSRENHTFKGTIDGVADLNNVHTISDGTNQYYLVSGNVTTDPATGRITGSTSGLIIGMDLDGSFVQLSEDDGYSVDPVAQSLDQFEEAERIRLQRQVTQVIDPNGTMTQQPTEQQSGNVGGEAGTNNSTGANEPPTPESANTVGAEVAAEWLLGSGQNAINSTDYLLKAFSGVFPRATQVIEAIRQKYAQQIANDPTLAEIKDFMNSPLRNQIESEIKDAINQAYPNNAEVQDIFDIIMQHPTGLPSRIGQEVQRKLDNLENQSAQPQQPAVTIESVTDKDGIKRYENGIAVDDAIADMIASGDDVNEIADASIAEAQAVVDKINGKATKTRKDLVDRKKAQDTITYYNNVKARWAEMNQPAESEENVNVEPEKPIVPEKPVSSQQNLTVEEQKQQRIAEAKAKYGELFDDDFTKANDVFELVSMWVGRNRNLAWDDVNGKRGLQKELGWTRKIGGDTKYIETLLAKKGEGMGVDEFAHMVWQCDENQGADGNPRFSTEEIKEALLDMIKSARSKSDVVDFALNNRIILAEQALQEQRQREQEEAEQQEEVVEPTDEEVARMEASLPFAKPVEGEDIPDSLITQLEKAIAELQKQEGMPPIKLVDTDRMSEKEWNNLAALYYGGEAFFGQEEIDRVRDHVLSEGVFFNPETSVITVLSDSQTPEDVNNKIQTILDYASTIQEKGRNNRNETDDVEGINDATPQGEGGETPAAEGANEPESQGSTGSVEDPYLQPRNAEEEQIVANVLAQLQQEIGDAVNERNKARSELQKAQARESERATDLFGNDNALNQEGQLFDNSDMPIDNSAEGVDRRTAAEREKLQEATNKLNRLQSVEERNSRIRGALDNYRRQTKIETENPIEAIEQAAQSFTEEQEEKKAYGADNKLVSKDRYEELKKRMRDKLLGQMNLGVDPEILAIGTEMAVYHIEAGARKFIDYATNMINDLGDAIRPYLKAFYEGARRLPEMSELSKEMDSVSDVDSFDILNYDKQPANTVNEHKEKDNEAENVVSSQQKPASELEGDSAEFADRQEKEKALRDDLKQELLHGVSGDRTLKTMQDVKKLAEKHGLDMSLTDLQEIVEAVIVDMARTYANSSFLTDKQKFDNIVALYQTQPTLSARDNDRINKQQYSTPAPMAYLMGQFLSNGKKVDSGLEPSAGNGMLTINLPKDKMHVNDIDEMRLSNLQKQGFGEVTSQDGLQSFGEKKFDVVVTNPPFGNVTPKVYDGIYEISGLEHQMAINALESMKDDGRAAIIIGGNTEYNQNGSIKGKDRAFLNYLYAHYNVVDVINMNGHELYSRQGTGFPVRMILINGRKEFNPRSFAPTIQKARAERVNSYDELFKRVNDDILQNNNNSGRGYSGTVVDSSNNNNGQASGQSDVASSSEHVDNANQEPVRVVRPGGSGRNDQLGNIGGKRVERTGDTTSVQSPTESRTDRTGNEGVRRSSSTDSSSMLGVESNAGDANGEGRVGGVSNGGTVSQRGDGKPETLREGTSRRLEEPQPKIELGTEKVPYRQQSNNPFALQSQMPAAQAEVVKKALEDIGDVDEFLMKELGYSSIEDMYRGSQDPSAHGGLAAEQIDSVAMAIHQMKNGDAFIIGDQTGIGKGRQGAALIRWACKQGMSPIYFTKTPDLFSGVYRDLKDIGSKGLRPFILASDEKGRITERQDGKDVVIYDLPTKKEVERVLDYINKNGKLPPEYDYVVTTYSQISNGTMDYENGQKKARTYKKGKSARPADINGQKKRDAIENLGQNSIVLMDESHEAGGDSARGNFLQFVSTKAKGITYISATFAKRPDNMPIYSLRTAISKAGVKIGDLIDAVKRGGATFQEIMSKALTEAGQMIRRERDMTGVTVDWKGIEDEDVIKKHYKQYDQVIGLFNDIIQFQRTYVDPIVNKMNDDAAEEQGNVDHTPGTRDMGINNAPFASRTHQIVKQVLLALKAEEGAKFAVECLKNGEKPVIALENTNEGAADKAVGSFDEDIEMPDLSINLKEGLRGTLRISKKDAFGNSVNTEIAFDSLSEAGQKRYAEIMDAIESASTGLSLSPIDVIRDVIKKAGYSVEELTGRSKVFDYNEDGTVKRVNRDKKKNKKRASDFNEGLVDALIVNKSACTGIDLHAGIKFKNTDQRHMIVVQPQADINDEVQMRGRTDRTGQKQHSKYTYIVSTIPSEQRLLMMLKAKLRSLDANTTSSQKSKFNEMQVQDIINKYGDDIVIQYLAEHPDLAMKMCDPLKWGEGAETLAPETLITQAQKVQGDGGTASKVLGRMALLTVKEQEKMLSEIGDLYQAEIDRLNEMGENDLEITEMPLRAKTVKKNVWEEGVEPGGKNPFADNSYIEEVEMDVLKKPMKGSEVKASQERLLGGKTWEEYKQATLEKADKWAEQKKAETTKTFTERAEKKAKAEQEKYVKGAKKAQEKNGMTDAEIEKNGKYQYDHFYKEEMDKLKTALEAIDNQKQVFVDALETFSTDGVYALPTDIYDLGGITFEPSFGKVIDINIKEDNYSTNASTITFATLDGRRKITIPINGMVKQNNGEKRDIKPIIVQQTAQTRNGMFGSNIANMLKVLEQNPDNWDKLTSTATRKKGHIITGNLLKALTSLRSQGKGGKLISYTTDTGEIRQGILMSDQFDPGTLMSKNPISSLKDNLRYDKDKVESDDGDVTVRVSPDFDWNKRGYNTLELIVPKSNKKGAKYFNDETLLSLMNGQFEGSSKMKAEFPRANLDAVMKRLDELGVTVQGEPKKDDDTNSGRRFDEDIEEAVTDTQKALQEKSVNLSTVEMETAPRSKEEAISRIPKEGKLFPNDDQGTDIKVTRRALRHGFRRGEAFEFQAVGAIDQIIKNAVKIGELPVDEDERGKTDSVSIFYAPVSIDGKIYSVRLTIKRYIDRKGVVLDDLAMYDMNLHNEKTDPSLTNVGTSNDELVSANESESGYKVKDLIYNSKKEDKDLVGINNRQTRFDENETSVTQSGDERKGKIAKHVEQLLDKLGTKDKTTVYHSFDELPDDMKAHIRERERQGKKVRGWYENGRIYLYLPHIDSEYAAEKTIWHETVAHHGLRQLIGEENLNKLLKQLWLTHREGEMGKWVAERMQKNGWALNEAIEEYLAREAEKNPFKEPGLWQRLKWMLADVLHKMGFSTDPTISDIQYLFWVSQNRLNENDPLTKAKQQAFLFNLEREAENTPYVNMNATRVEDISRRFDEDLEEEYTEEEQTIIDDAKKNGTYMKAPNGKKSNLSPKQWVRVKTEAFKKWFGDWENDPVNASKVVDENGEPMVVYHGSPFGGIESFDRSQNKADASGLKEFGTYFTTNRALAEMYMRGRQLTDEYRSDIEVEIATLQSRLGDTRNIAEYDAIDNEIKRLRSLLDGRVYEVFLNIRNPKEFDAKGQDGWHGWHELKQDIGYKTAEGHDAIEAIAGKNSAAVMDEQYDGIIAHNIVDIHGEADEQLRGDAILVFDKDASNIKSATENVGTYDSRNKGIRYSEDIEEPMSHSAKWIYNDRLNRVETVFTEAYQDAMVSLKTAQNAIAGDKSIPDSQNAYMAENLMHGKNGTEQQVFDATIRDRILDTVKKMMAISGMRMGDIDRYCFAKHGLERNRELFVRDWLKSERRKSIKSYEDLNQDEQEIFHDLEEKLHEQFDDGIIETEEELNKKLEKALQQAHDEYIDSVEDGYVKMKERRFADLKDRKITLSQYLDEIDKYIQQNIDGEYVASEHDYSGFRSMYGDENGEYNEDEIIAEVMTDEGIFGNDLTDEFWAGVNEASRYGLERYREAGMRSDEQIDKVEQMFHFYVPMRGFKEDRGEDMYQYFTGNSKEVSHLGGLLKHAKGRKSEASYPLATLFALTYKAISDCNQNLVNQKFYRLCQANPNDLVVLSDSWAELDENTGEWEEVYPPIPEDAGEEEIRQAMMAFEEEMRQKELEGKAKKLKGKPKFDYRPADKKKRDEHIVEVYMNGQKRLMTIVGNPRAAQALNGFTRFHIGDNWLSHANAAAKNWMSKVSTSYNPTFAARNMFRDWTHFAMILITREGSGYAKAAQGYYHPMRMKRLFDKFKAGTLDMNNEEERDFKDFMDNGGITGYVRMNKVKDMQDDVESIIKKAQQTGVIKNANKLWDSVLGAVEAWNEAIENSARFATFRASRHYAGRTKARSAYDAKEVTVNFNRKGAGSNTAGFKSTDKKVERAAKLSGYSAQLLGEGRMFFNATLQAVATIFKNFKNPDGSWNTKYIKRFAGAYASVPFVGGMLIPAINMALMNLFGGDGDDDPYANLPEWVRRKNICIWLGWIPGMEEKLAGTEHSDFFKDSFLTIPVGQEIAAFYSLGDLAASLTFYPELKPVDLSLEKEFWGFLNVFSPIDLDTKVTNGGLYSSDFVPEALGRVSTVLAPAIAVQQNLSWTGRKIYREDKYKGDESIPEYQMVYNNTNSGYIWVSKGLNYLGGGDDIERGGKILGIIPSQVNPGAMQYLVEQYSGGPGKFASNTSSAVRDFYEMALGDKGEANFNVRKVEILKAFIQQADDNTKFYRAKAKYRRYKEEAEERSAQLSRAQKDAKENPEHYMKAEELSKGVEAARMYFIKENDKTLKAINKEIYSSTGQKRKDFQALYNQKLSEMVDSLDNMKPVEEMYRRERK